MTPSAPRCVYYNRVLDVFSQSGNDGTISLSSIVMRPPGAVAETIDEVTAVMSLDKDAYFLLESTGSAIWNRLAVQIRVSDLCAGLMEDFAVEPAACESDVIEFLNELSARGLLRVVG